MVTDLPPLDFSHVYSASGHGKAELVKGSAPISLAFPFKDALIDYGIQSRAVPKDQPSLAKISTAVNQILLQIIRSSSNSNNRMLLLDSFLKTLSHGALRPS
jgi:hypothetical protein